MPPITILMSKNVKKTCRWIYSYVILMHARIKRIRARLFEVDACSTIGLKLKGAYGLKLPSELTTQYFFTSLPLLTSCNNANWQGPCALFLHLISVNVTPTPHFRFTSHSVSLPPEFRTQPSSVHDWKWLFAYRRDQICQHMQETVQQVNNLI